MFALTILGNNSAIPAYGRNPTAQVLQTQEEAYLIDCGEGTQMQMSKYKVKRSRINRIFISHMHGDHYFGLIGLLTSMGLMGRTADMHIFGPPPLQAIIQIHLDAANVTLPFPIYFHQLGLAGVISNDHRVEVYAFPVHHRIPTWGFKFTEIRQPRHIDPERANAFEIPASAYPALQQGEDYVHAKGTIVPNEEVTTPGIAPRTYAYCADTLFDASIASVVAGADLLYHESTYLHDLQERAASRFHSTSVEAAQIAKLANVKKLLLGHFSSKYEDLSPFLEEARPVFENTELALEGACFPV